MEIVLFAIVSAVFGYAIGHLIGNVIVLWVEYPPTTVSEWLEMIFLSVMTIGFAVMVGYLIVSVAP